MLFRVPYKSPFLKEIRISMEKSTSIYAIPCHISKEILEPCFLLSLQQLINPNKINNNPAITVAHFLSILLKSFSYIRKSTNTNKTKHPRNSCCKPKVQVCYPSIKSTCNIINRQRNPKTTASEKLIVLNHQNLLFLDHVKFPSVHYHL